MGISYWILSWPVGSVDWPNDLLKEWVMNQYIVNLKQEVDDYEWLLEQAKNSTATIARMRRCISDLQSRIDTDIPSVAAILRETQWAEDSFKIFGQKNQEGVDCA